MSTGRNAKLRRSARSPNDPCARRCTRRLPESAVELRRREKRRRRPQDLIGPAQLPILPLQLGDPTLVLVRHPRPPTTVDLGLVDPVPQRLGPYPQLPGDPPDHPVTLTALLDGIHHKPNRPLPKLGRIPLLRRM